MPLLEKGKKNASLRFWLAVTVSLWLLQLYNEARFGTSLYASEEARRIFLVLGAVSYFYFAVLFAKRKDYILVGLALITPIVTIFILL